jgi:hypothetical protein
MGFKKTQGVSNGCDFVEPELAFDNGDFTKLIDVMDSHRFGVEMHKRIVEETRIVMNEQSQFDMNDISRILAQYPRYFSWIIVEAEVLNEKFLKEERDFNTWYKMKYMDASDAMAGKTTINAIEAKVVQLCAVEKREMHKKLNLDGKSEAEIAEILKYEGLDGRQNKVMEYQTKANMAKGMVKVWANAINSLQSLSKNIVTEAELIKRQLGG